MRKKFLGFSLIELLITMAISSILLLVIVGLINMILQRSHGGFASFRAQTEAQASLNNMAKDLRQATQLVSAQEQSIVFREYVGIDDTVPSQVRFYLEGTTLKRGEVPPSGTGPDYIYDPADEKSKILAFDVINGADRIFSYFDQNGIELTTPVALGAVTLVGIDLTFEQLNNPQSFKVSTKVQLRLNKTNL